MAFDLHRGTELVVAFQHLLPRLQLLRPVYQEVFELTGRRDQIR